MPSLNDNSLATANDLGILSGVREIVDSFDAIDRLTYYRFTLSQNSNLARLFNAAPQRFGHKGTGEVVYFSIPSCSFFYIFF
jgi:hypothetical protein